MKKRLGLFAFTLLVTGCSSSYNPVAIKLNTDSCYTCHMGIENEQSASESILEDGTPRTFDDIGCMVVYLKETKDKVHISYVHDQQNKWVDFNKAFYVHQKKMDTQSPMGYGILAFASKEEALQYQKDKGGDVFSKDELLKADVKEFKQRNMDMDSMGSMKKK